MGEDKSRNQKRLALVEAMKGHDSKVPHQWNSTGGACPKCGCSNLVHFFCLPYQSELPYLTSCELQGEHIHRGCGACRYYWVERPLDATLAAQERGEYLAESEMAAAIAAIAHAQNGIRLDRTVVSAFKGWKLLFHRDPSDNTLTITTEKPPEEGKICHPQVPKGGPEGIAS